MNHKKYESDIILYKNKKYSRKKKSYKAKIKSSKAKCVFYSLYSNLYGYTYMTIQPKVYNKLRKISNIKFSYKFLDGSVADDIEADMYDIWIKNTYLYDDARELFSKIYEIILIEYCLNELFWVFDSYYSYIFNDFKISFTYMKKKYKFKDIDKFYKFIFGDNKSFGKDILENGIASFGKRYKLIPKKDIMDKSKYKNICDKIKDNDNLYSMGSSQYTYVNPKFFKKIKTIEAEHELCIQEIYSEEQDYCHLNSISYTYDNLDVILLYMISCSPLIVDNLESSNTDYIKYCINDILMKVNGKKIKKRKENLVKRVLNKYFPGTKFSLINEKFWRN